MFKKFLIAATFAAISAPVVAQKDISKEYETIFLEIAPHTRQCTAVGVFQCLQYKKFVYDENGKKIYQNKEWYNLYGGIEGYKHRPDQQVILRVKAYDVYNPPADGSSIMYVLDKYVETKTVNNKKK